MSVFAARNLALEFLYGGADILVCPNGARKTERFSESARRDKMSRTRGFRAGKNACPTNSRMSRTRRFRTEKNVCPTFLLAHLNGTTDEARRITISCRRRARCHAGPGAMAGAIAGIDAPAVGRVAAGFAEAVCALHPLSAAAAMLIVGNAIGLTWHRHPTDRVAKNPTPPPAVLLETHTEPAFQNDLIPVRAPSALEVMLIEARKPVNKKPAKPASGENIDTLANEVVKQAEGSVSEGELGKLADSLASRHEYAECFSRIAATSNASHRIAAVRLLARCGDRDSGPALLTFYGNRATHDAALPGVARLADAVTLGGLIRDERFAADQPALLEALLQREPGAATAVYLSLIKDGAISTNSPGPRNVPRRTMDILFAYLNDPHLETRIAAARGLGRIDGPVTTVRLVGMVETDVNRREALMALAYSNGREARDYLARAQESIALRGAVRSVLLQIR